MSVYILTNTRHTTLYVGVTNNLPRRMMEHKLQTQKRSFTAKYNLTKLVYYCTTDSIIGAISEEKRIKGGSRAKKIALIASMNPEWKDLSEELDITDEMIAEMKKEQGDARDCFVAPPRNDVNTRDCFVALSSTHSAPPRSNRDRRNNGVRAGSIPLLVQTPR